MRDIFMDFLFLIAYLKCSFKLSKTLDYSPHQVPQMESREILVGGDFRLENLSERKKIWKNPQVG